MLGEVSSGGTSSGRDERACAPLYSSVLLPNPAQPARISRAAAAARNRSCVMEWLPLRDAAGIAQRAGEGFVVGRRERREREADALGDAAHAVQRPLHRDGIGLEEEVL